MKFSINYSSGKSLYNRFVDNGPINQCHYEKNSWDIIAEPIFMNIFHVINPMNDLLNFEPM